MKPLASLSLDLDNKWSYMKTHGDAGWETFPSYLDVVVPRALSFLKERNLTITFFIVGQDAALSKNHAALRSISAAGHEIGNHSFHHEPWLHLYSEAEIESELARAEDEIERATNYKPVGFRGPGFSLSEETLRVLARRGYEYDATTFPTFLGPLARAYYLMTAKMDAEEKRRRRALFGKFSDGFQSLKPYRWNLKQAQLLEIPVTTMPVFKAPAHVSYLLYLSSFSTRLALSYFRIFVELCRLTRTEPSLLLHPLDFLGADDDADLSFFPAMKLKSERKLHVVSEALKMLAERFTIVPMREHARAVTAASDLPLREPHFHHSRAGASPPSDVLQQPR